MNCCNAMRPIPATSERRARPSIAHLCLSETLHGPKSHAPARASAGKAGARPSSTGGAAGVLLRSVASMLCTSARSFSSLAVGQR